MQSEVNGDSAAFTGALQHVVLLRRLQRSQIDNALIKKKAQQLIALKTFHRSVELRRQLSQAQATNSSSGRLRKEIDSPTLDPSVKALIDKLSEIAELLPSKFRGDESTFAGDRNEQNVVAQGKYGSNTPVRSQTSSSHNVQSAASVRGLQGRSTEISSGDGWEEDESGRNRDVPAGKQEGGEGVLESEKDNGNSSHEVMIPSNENNDDLPGGVMSQQLKDLDLDVDSLFQDLEKKQASNTDADSTDGTREPTTKELDLKQKRTEIARKKEKAALLAQLEARSGGGECRHPKWRWIAQGVPNPDPDRVLQGKTLWRAVVFLVIVFYVRPKRQLMQRKARSKDRETQDWNATLTIYFDRCQTWLLKVARVPVGNSVLKNSKLNFRLNHLESNREAHGATTQGGGKTGSGLVRALIRKFVLGTSHENLVLTLTRLKVHVKGVLLGLTEENPPSDIMTFFSYLAGDGNYFPQDFFSEEESKVISFDDLGAVRRLAPSTSPPGSLESTLYALHPSVDLQLELKEGSQHRQEGFLEAHHLGWLVPVVPHHGGEAKMEKADATVAVARLSDLRAAVLHGRKELPGKLRPVYHDESSDRWFDTSVVEMILTNYLMVRVLIPWILLYPRESGLVPSSGVKNATLTHNCQVLASAVYLIVRVLRPELAPPNDETMKAAVAAEIERARKIAAKEAEGEHEADGSEGGSDREENEDEKEGRPGNSNSDNLDPKAAPDDANGNRGENKKINIMKRRRSRAAVPASKPRTVQQIMLQKRDVGVSDTQLVRGLLSDAYFLPFIEHIRPWVLELAAEFDAWMQKVIVVVMSKVGASTNRHEKVGKEMADEKVN